jgi:NADH-quinone oxidoreductase subunit N
MSAPLIWIVFPAGLAIGLFFISQHRRLTSLVAGLVCLVLALLAWQTNIGQPIHIGPLSFQIATTLSVAGRRLVLDNADRSFLTFVYLMGSLWFFGAQIAKATRLFVPTGLGMLGLLIAAQAVEPFLYAALLIEVAVLLSIPMLNPPGQPASRGVQRYLIFMTMAVPFILLAGWASEAIEANPNSPRLLTQAAVLMGLGFAFWLAVFPFYTWVPLLAAETHPYPTGFVLSFVPGVILFLALVFLDNFSWLRSSPGLAEILRLVGTLMILTGGIWAAFQNDVRRMFGYGVILESGFALLELGLASSQGYQIFAISLAPRYIGLALFALALSVFNRAGVTTTHSGLAGRIRSFPLAGSGLLAAYFSMAGLPLLGQFPVRQALLDGLATVSLPLTLTILIGMLGFWTGGLRLLYTLAGSTQPGWTFSETRLERVLLAGGILMLLLIGLFPDRILPSLLDLIKVYPHLR